MRTRASRSVVVLAADAVELLESRIALSVGAIPAVPTPVAYWKFDDGTGTTAIDASGNNHNATLSGGASWVSGNIGTKAMRVNATATGLATASGPVVNTANSFTVSAWVNLSSVSGYQTVVSIAGTNVAGFYLGLRGDTGSLSFARLASDATVGASVVAAPSAPSTGTWYHIVGVNDAAAHTLELFVDGVSVGSVGYASGWTAGGDTLIGHGFYGGNHVDYVNGSIDEVQFFSSALTAAQIAVLDQPAAYSLDDGAGTTAADVSGHAQSLTLAGGASWVAGRLGSNAISVDGTSTGNAIYGSAVVNTARPFSVSAWVKLDSTSGYQTFVSIDGTNVSGFFLQLRSNTGRFAFTRLVSDSNSAATNYASATSAPTAGVWYHLLGVNDVANNRLSLYVNGVFQSSATYSGGGWQANGATVVGGGKYNGTRVDFASGQIDDVRFFNSPLSAPAAAYLGTNGASTITVNTTSTGVNVSPDLFGMFMEDINYGGEGGIYNDEIRNAGFNDSTDPLRAWSAITGSGVTANLTSDATTGPTTALSKSGKLTITSGVSSTARAGIANSGYFGVAVVHSMQYDVEFYAKATGYTGPLTVALESNTGTVYAKATVSSISSSWTKYTVTLQTGAEVPSSSTNRFVIYTTSAAANGATIWFGSAHCFPPSYKGVTTNHLRPDLMEKLADLKPAVFRVPGGNYLEGNVYADRFNWSQTIGRLEDRPGHLNSAWGYWSTDGMGLDEYLQMAEEVGARPLLAVYAGYTLLGASDTGATLAADVTDAINELHYVLDPVTTSWGALRAANGHPAPYDVREVEVGNEDWFSSTYPTRYPLFYDAIRASFPSLKIVASHTATGGRPYDIIDEHYYNSPQWFMSNQGLYDNRTRGSVKVMVGEYAANQAGPTGNLIDALGDATFMLGMMKNSDLVTMSMYAPIWANVNGIQWDPDMIGFDNLTSYGSPTYWAQQMLATQHGATVVNSTLSGANGLKTLVTHTGPNYYVTVINTAGAGSNTTLNLAGVSSAATTGTAITLAGSSASATNSITNPEAIVPVTSSISGLGTTFTYNFAPYSITILKFSAGTNNAPTFANTASAAPSTVAGTSTNLSVLGADDGGESNLVYTWSVLGTPPAPVVFDVNGSNEAKSTAAEFMVAGTYNLRVTINDGTTLITSDVTVTVNRTPSAVAITGSSSPISVGQTRAFGANVEDQFGDLIAGASVTWSLGAGSVGNISTSGLYTASAQGSATIIATSGPVSRSLTISVVRAAPTFVTPATATPGTVTGTTVALSALATDDSPEASLVYTWSLASGPASVVFSSNNSNASKNSTATFHAAGPYVFKITVTDVTGQSASSNVSVTVASTATSLSITPTAALLGTGQTKQFTPGVRNQFGATIAGAAITWTIDSGLGTVSSTGLFTAPTTAGKAVLRATYGSLTATANATVFSWSPYSLTTRKVTTNTVAISFRDSTTVETGFQLQVGKRLSTGVIQWTTTYALGIASGSGTTVNYAIPSTFAAGAWYFRVRATSSAGYSNWSNTATIAI